jgi:hypothetical protein
MVWRLPPLSRRARALLTLFFVGVLAVGIFGDGAGGSYTYGRPAHPVLTFVFLSGVVAAAIWSMGRPRR